jgi:hypothetical protein
LFCAVADDTIRELRKHGAYKDLYDERYPRTSTNFESALLTLSPKKGHDMCGRVRRFCGACLAKRPGSNAGPFLQLQLLLVILRLLPIRQHKKFPDSVPLLFIRQDCRLASSQCDHK